MQANPEFWAGRAVCVTGGSGFLGFQLVRRLCRLGARVRAFGLRPPADHPLWSLGGVDVETGDVRDDAAVRQAVRGCAVVFHTAGALPSFRGSAAAMMAVHKEGTRNVIDALPSGARLVHTSSVVAVGASRQPAALDEDSPFTLHHLAVPYVHAKRLAEGLALSAAGRDVVVVNPAYLIGPDDHEPSALGRLCLRAWKGRVPVATPGGFNFVDVRDVAEGHLRAAEHGRAGRRYILGGEDHSQRDFLTLAAGAAGRAPWLLATAPRWLVSAAACVAEWRARRSGSEPSPTREQARMVRHYWYYRSDRARQELGYESRGVADSLRDALAWHAGRRDVRPRGLNAWLLPRRAA
jgi:dihydroflavonol-4-reductase